MKRLLSLAVIAATTACNVPQRSAPMGASTSKTPLPGQPSQNASSPAAAGQPGAAPATPANICFNTQYHLSCLIPDGFIMTDEGMGPGKIMTMVPRSMRSDVTANLDIFARRIGQNQTLEHYMTAHFVDNLKDAKGIVRVDQSTMSYGNQLGFEVAVERQYANGVFKSKTFGFVRRPDIFIIDYASPADFFDHNPDPVKKFVESLSFTDLH